MKASARIGDFSGNRGSGSRQGAGQQRPAAFALPAFKITVAGADGILPGFNLVAIHGDAHAAARFAPFGAGFLEDGPALRLPPVALPAANREQPDAHPAATLRPFKMLAA